MKTSVYHDGYGAEHLHEPANCPSCGAPHRNRCDDCGAELNQTDATTGEAIHRLIEFICTDYINGILLCEAIRGDLSLDERAAKLQLFAQKLVAENQSMTYSRQAVYERNCAIGSQYPDMRPYLLSKVGVMSRNHRHFGVGELACGDQLRFDDLVA